MYLINELQFRLNLYLNLSDSKFSAWESKTEFIPFPFFLTDIELKNETTRFICGCHFDAKLAESVNEVSKKIWRHWQPSSSGFIRPTLNRKVFLKQACLIVRHRGTVTCVFCSKSKFLIGPIQFFQNLVSLLLSCANQFEYAEMSIFVFLSLKYQGKYTFVSNFTREQL